MNFEHTEYMKFAIFEDCINHTQATSYYFSGYHAEIIAHTSHEFDATLKQIEHYQADGFYLAGYVSYHAANSIYPKLTLKPSATPLLHFMVFTQAQQFAAQDLIQLRPELSQDTPLLKFNYLELNSDYDGYQQKFEQVQQQLKSGNTYQLNLTTPINISIKERVNPLNLYYQLSRSHPVTYAAYLPFDNTTIMSISPELFFKKTASTISVRPMKGTAPRGNTIQEDNQNREFLQNDNKNRAENLIIVDLLRNDLAKFCQTGSIEVPALFAIEKYQSVFQMTSSIQGTIENTTDFATILKGLFPCGSITGAPKLRTMQLIEQIENYPRDIYTGAIGYILPNNDMQFNVAIRTLKMANNTQQITMGVGGGITIQSQAKEEWQEITTKLRFVRKFYQPDFKLIESFLVKDYLVINLTEHLKRLQSSADKLIFKCNIEVIKNELLSYTASNILTEASYKLRLELDYCGEIKIEHSLIAKNPEALTVMLSPVKIDSSHGLFCHKTDSAVTRGVYTQIDQEHKPQGVDELIFVNQDSIITEARYHNVIIEYHHELLTSPINQGLLGGIYRANLVHEGKIKELPITKQMLDEATAIYLCNDVRGMIRCNLIRNGAKNALDN
ncbi:MAG: aminodeoxychorismate synthase component I [Neisseriaceae bacterium]|nr:MAG: aminodeoxychorismate synthase component I [Neisseriaceae bacterium]